MANELLKLTNITVQYPGRHGKPELVALDDVSLTIYEGETLGLVGHVRTIFGGYKTRIKLDGPFEAGRNGAAVVRSSNDQASLTFELETKSGTIWLKDADAENAAENQ